MSTAQHGQYNASLLAIWVFSFLCIGSYNYSVPLLMNTVVNEFAWQDGTFAEDSVTNDSSPLSSALPVSNSSLSSVSKYSPVFNTGTTPVAPGKLTLVMHNGGEMANNLCHLAALLSMQLLAREEYQLETEILIKAQDSPKWKRAAGDLQQCFPNLKEVNFRAGNGPDLPVQRQQQQEIFGSNVAETLHRASTNLSQLRSVLELVQALQANYSTSSLSPQLSASNSTVSFPYIGSKDMLCEGELLDRYFPQVQQFLAFDYDNPNCCALKPFPNETVFHFRGFSNEMGPNAQLKSFEELSPHQVAHVLLAHLQPGDAVAVVSRFSGDDYVQALRERGLVARGIQDQTGVQDFCFLLHAQRELVGTLRSSFAIWAAYLNPYKPPTALYVADSKNNRRRANRLIEGLHSRKWSPQDPRRKIKYLAIPTT